MISPDIVPGLRGHAVLATIDGSSAEPLSPELEDRILLREIASQAEGALLDLSAAHRGRLIRTWKENGFHWTALVFAGSLFFVPPDELVACIVIVLAIVGVLLLMGSTWNERWRDGVEPLVPDMPRPATLVRVGDDGLTVGAATTPWDAIEIDRIDLRRLRALQAPRRYLIDRLHLRTVSGRLVLDGALITRGQQVLDSLFHRLRPLAET